MRELYQSFTLVFEGDIRTFKMNPLNTETPWGTPYAVCCWDALEEGDELREALERSPRRRKLPMTEPVFCDFGKLERAVAQRDALVKALEPFAKLLEMIECTTSHEYSDTDSWDIPIGDLRRARDALALVGGTQGD